MLLYIISYLNQTCKIIFPKQNTFIFIITMYLPPSKASDYLGISKSKLRSIRIRGIIECYKTDGGQWRYSQTSLDTYKSGIIKDEKKKNFIYARVSSSHQKEDLQRQIDYLRQLYPRHTIIKDIGSGLNFKRRGLRTLLERSMQGIVGEVVISYKDRLCRFGYDLIEWFITSNGGKITCECSKNSSTEQELTEDLVAVISVFSARIHGSRSYKRKRQIQNEENKDKTKQKTTKMA